MTVGSRFEAMISQYEIQTIQPLWAQISWMKYREWSALCSAPIIPRETATPISLYLSPLHRIVRK